MRVLITGITGFAGGHLADVLLRGGAEVHGASRKAKWPDECRHLADRVSLHAADISEPARVEALLRDVRPEQIYHLAGYAKPGQSYTEVDEAWRCNLTATRSLYDAVARWGGKPRILFISSGLVYGESEGLVRLEESAVLRPTSPYASSKAAADLTSYQYAHHPGLDIVRARPFNHIGPRQSPSYAAAHFAQQIAAIERKERPPVLETGNLSPIRDLTDVRDTVRAYTLLMAKGKKSEAYNVSSGEAWSMQKVVDHLLTLTDVAIEVRRDPKLVRATDTKATLGDASKLRRETGWEPHYKLEQTLKDMLDFFRRG